MYLPLSVWVLCWSLFWYALLCVHTSFAIILTRKREMVALLLLFFWCLVAVNVLWSFLTVSWVGLQCVIVVFPDHTHLLFHTLVVFSFKKASGYDEEMLQSHRQTIKGKQPTLFPSGMIAQPEELKILDNKFWYSMSSLVFNFKLSIQCKYTN